MADNGGRAADWKGAFNKQNATAFDDAFADDVVLEAAVLNSPIIGRDQVCRVMAAASKLYESLTFTHEADADNRHYVEWRGKAFGGVDLFGVTVLTRNSAGQLSHIAIHHRPLQAALEFSRRVGESVEEVIDSRHFLTATE